MHRGYTKKQVLSNNCRRVAVHKCRQKPGSSALAALHDERLSPQEVHEARRLYAQGWSQARLAERFGVGKSSVSRIIRGATYTAADGPVGTNGRKGQRNGRARLGAEEVREIRARARQGEKLAVLAEAFGVSIWAVSDIVRRRNWAWLPDDEDLVV